VHSPIKLTQLFRNKLTHIFAGVNLHSQPGLTLFVTA
jgi:hypothetical protein